MKLTSARAAAFLRRPDRAVMAVLLFGPDGGLVRERSLALARTVLDDPGDPFRTTEITAADLSADRARLADEAAAIALTGGRRVVWVRDAGDAVSAVFESVLADPPCRPEEAALILVEAGELGPRSRLRRLFEGAANAAALPCYGDEAADLTRLVGDGLRRRGVSATAEAIAYLGQHLGADRMVTRGEIEKLALYAGDGGEIDLREAAACVGDSAILSLEDVAFAAGGGHRADLIRALDRVFLEGAAPVQVLRVVARHFQRLHLAAAHHRAGAAADRAMAALKPPVFYKRRGAFRAQIALWPPHRAAAAMNRLIRAELDCKRTGMPAEAICRRAVEALAEAAAPPAR